MIFNDNNDFLKNNPLDLEKIIELHNSGILQWSHKNKKENQCWAILYAARTGKLDIVKWLWENKYCNDPFIPLEEAIKHGQIDIVKWIDKTLTKGEEKYPVFSMMDHAARHGKLDIVKYFYENKRKYSYQAMYNAGHYGHFDVVKWLFENKCVLRMPKVTLNMLMNRKQYEIADYFINKNITNLKYMYRFQYDKFLPYVQQKLKKIFSKGVITNAIYNYKLRRQKWARTVIGDFIAKNYFWRPDSKYIARMVSAFD
jgi:hypothetical protein